MRNQKTQNCQSRMMRAAVLIKVMVQRAIPNRIGCLRISYAEKIFKDEKNKMEE